MKDTEDKPFWATTIHWVRTRTKERLHFWPKERTFGLTNYYTAEGNDQLRLELSVEVRLGRVEIDCHTNRPGTRWVRQEVPESLTADLHTLLGRALEIMNT